MGCTGCTSFNARSLRLFIAATVDEERIPRRHRDELIERKKFLARRFVRVLRVVVAPFLELVYPQRSRKQNQWRPGASRSPGRWKIFEPPRSLDRTNDRLNRSCSETGRYRQHRSPNDFGAADISIAPLDGIE